MTKETAILNGDNPIISAKYLKDNGLVGMQSKSILTAKSFKNLVMASIVFKTTRLTSSAQYSRGRKKLCFHILRRCIFLTYPTECQ